MNAADMWTIATSLADSPIPKWFAGFLIASAILAALILAARPFLRRADNACHLALDEDTETITWTKEPTP